MTDSEEQPSSQRATREQLESMHGLLAKILLDYMRNTPPEKLRSNRLDLVRAFLKDNRCTKDINSGREVKAALADLADDELPFLPQYLDSTTLN
jgi:hypothetical protein